MEIVFKKFTPEFSRNSISIKQKVLALGISAFLLLAISRADVVILNVHSVKSVLTFLPRILLVAYSDGFYVLCVTTFFILLLYLAEKRKTIQKILYYVYCFVILFSLVASFLNVVIVEAIGTPFTYQWLYYSDFLGSTDAQNAIMANLNWKLFATLFLLIIGLLICSWICSLIFSYVPKKFNAWKYSLPVIGFSLVLYSFSSNRYRESKKLDSVKLANPIVFFLKSAIAVNKSPALFTMNVPQELKDEFGDKNKLQESKTIFSDDHTQSDIKNVILFVLESVPASYIQVYGGTYPVTPQLNKLVHESLWFKNVYAHTPTTPYAMVSLLASLYPIISYKGVTAQQPEINIATIGSELKKRGYKTAFFNSGDIRFQQADKFLKNQKFDVIEDYRGKHCSDRQFIVKENRWDNPDGSDDDCLVDSFDEWVGQNNEQPFFATLWTVQTHYPYFVSGEEKEYCTSGGIYCNNKYLNAIRHSDEVLGKLMQTLKSRNLDQSTLVVVIGDHGEAFGQHDQHGHASGIYEENLHVPLFFINSQLFKGERSDRIAGQVDVAPTIMDILDFPVPESWQGRSLLKGNQRKRVYFFSPWSDYLFGYREGDFKFIYNATNNTNEVYNLRTDSLETINLAGQMPADTLVKSYQYLAAWVQYQDKFMKNILSAEE